MGQEVHGGVRPSCKDRAQEGVDDVLVQVELVLESVVVAGQECCLRAQTAP